MIPAPFAELVIDFVQKGADVLKAAIDENKVQLEDAKRATDAVGMASQIAAQQATAGFAKATSGLTALQGALGQTGAATSSQFTSGQKTLEKFGAAAITASQDVLTGFTSAIAGVQGLESTWNNSAQRIKATATETAKGIAQISQQKPAAGTIAQPLPLSKATPAPAATAIESPTKNMPQGLDKFRHSFDQAQAVIEAIAALRARGQQVTKTAIMQETKAQGIETKPANVHRILKAQGLIQPAPEPAPAKPTVAPLPATVKPTPTPKPAAPIPVAAPVAAPARIAPQPTAPAITRPPVAAPALPQTAIQAIGPAATTAAATAKTSLQGIVGTLANVGSEKDKLIANLGKLGTAASSAATTATGGFGKSKTALANLDAALPHLLRSLGNANLALQVIAQKVITPTVKVNTKEMEQGLARIQVQLAGIQKGVQSVGGIATVVYAQAGMQLLGWVRAGLAASAMGQVMGLHMEMLARTIGGIFAPEIQTLIDWIAKLRDWLENLSQRQKENIAIWVKKAAVMLGVAMVMPKIVAGIGLVITAVKALGLAFTVAGGGILPVIATIAAGLLAIGAASKIGQEPLGGFLGTFGDIARIAMSAFTAIQTAMAPILESAGRLWEAFQPVLVQLIGLVANLGGTFAEIIGPMVALLADSLVPILAVVADVISLINAALDNGIVKWALTFALVTAIAVRAIPALLTSLTALVAGLIRAVVASIAWIAKQIAMLALMGPLGWAILAGAAAIGVAAAALAAAHRGTRPASGTGTQQETRPRGGRSQLAPRLGGFEAIEAAYFRVSQAAVLATSGRMESNIPQQSLNHLEAIDHQTALLNHQIGGMRPGMAGVTQGIGGVVTFGVSTAAANAGGG